MSEYWDYDTDPDWANSDHDYDTGYAKGKAEAKEQLNLLKQELALCRNLLQQAHGALEANDIDPELTRQIATRLKQKDF